jgi:hypothetical protein
MTESVQNMSETSNIKDENSVALISMRGNGNFPFMRRKTV